MYNITMDNNNANQNHINDIHHNNMTNPSPAASATPDVTAAPNAPTISDTPTVPKTTPQTIPEMTTSPAAPTMTTAQDMTATSEAPAASDSSHSRKNQLPVILSIAAGALAVSIIVFFAASQLFNNSNNLSNNSADDNFQSDSTPDEQPGPSSGSTDNDDIVNTELTGGTVTTTIDGKTITYSAAYLVDGIDAIIGSGTYESLADNQVTFLVINGGSLEITGDVTINKSGSANFQGRGDDYSFYGTNSAIVVVGENSSATLDGVRIYSSVSGANAVVATNGGKVSIQNSLIETSSDNSRGLHATYGGAIDANTVSISTKGGSSAALATDRGAGKVTATKMTLDTAGAGSPLIYSTGDITVTNSTGAATGAQIAVVEGKNSITIDGCDFTANGIGNRNLVDNAGIMIYQSMSGDASTGTGTFTASNSTFTIPSSSSVYTTTPLFFVTNTEAVINLTDVKASFYPDGYFILASGTDEWGKSGQNGGKVTINATGLDATNANIGLDDISTVTGM